MYESHFGLHERPFSIAPNPRFLFLSQRYREALAHLLYGVRERGGFVQLTGVVGIGKTTLTRALLEQLPDTVDTALVLNPTVTPRELLLTICEELGIAVPADAGIPALMNTLRDHLLAGYASGRQTLVLIDEAQNLSPEALEQVRLLTNLETNREKLLQIILVGQPELRDLLALPGLRQVAQRVTARYHLTPLRWQETRRYIQHRLRIAGAKRPLFSWHAMRIIHARAGGIPRLINVIADRALLGAYARGRKRVGAGIARRAAREVLGQPSRRPSWLLPTVVASMLLIAAIAAWPPLRGWLQALPQPALPQAQEAVAAPQPAALAQLLRDRDSRLRPDTAIKQLFRLWQARFAAHDEATACEQAQRQGLACRVDDAGLEALIARGLPVVLELLAEDGIRHAVLLLGIRQDQAVIALDDARLAVPLAQLAARWSGSSLTLWRPPAAVEQTLRPGQQGPAVAWLRRQLERIDGRPYPAGDRFDDALQQRIRAFQAERGLTVDGIVGSDTLFHLVLAAPPAGYPRLQRE